MNVIFADEDLWLIQALLVEIYQSSKSNISEHLTNIFNDNDLDREVVVQDFRTTTADVVPEKEETYMKFLLVR